MIISDAFSVAVPPAQVWDLLLDVPRVTPCIPNARITERIDDRTYRAMVGLKVGPVSVTYTVTVAIVEADEWAQRVVIRVSGDEAQGRGAVNAIATATVRAEGEGEGTRVDLETDAQIAGIVATVGGRLIEGVAKKTTATFAKNVAAALADVAVS